ncbi:hypothetical protein O6H91_06G099300 [Diphasiastrum complanatum]|uniref:Uncharacterized protein n=1 Tax=Diphasiastrum complanatum TaxID=34168 RepID=A0ACC2DGN7_DIPCM|nr:hypothetical protein O6H91_Y496200 [Diphasiastrum complanatum]KAJ7553466.1 hypothetical protein O6H91_06G099300 [Diphasiastrum complanatum]
MSRLTVGIGDYGCVHYRRRCRIRSPCCGKVFSCRHCHNDAMNLNERDPSKRHDLPRHSVERVICSLCGSEQEVSQVCKKCQVCMGEYFCETCKFFDDDTTKNQFHCVSCGICRVGGKDNFFHCEKCGCCYSIQLQKRHFCVENAMHHNCPVCFNYLFDSVDQIAVMPCGHTIHAFCLTDMYRHSQYSCPMCSKSVCDMSSMWDTLDREVAATPMPDIYRDKMVWILCNDCGESSSLFSHYCSEMPSMWFLQYSADYCWLIKFFPQLIVQIL